MYAFNSYSFYNHNKSKEQTKIFYAFSEQMHSSM